MGTVVIRGGTLVTDKTRRRADLRCSNGRIARIDEAIATSAGDEVVDAGGCYVMPGGIDPHTHMQLEMMGTVVADDFFTGTAAAAAGGTTSILDFVGPEPGQSPFEALAIYVSGEKVSIKLSISGPQGTVLSSTVVDAAGNDALANFVASELKKATFKKVQKEQICTQVSVSF